MNSCVLIATLVTAPQLRYTPDEQKVTEALVEFPGMAPESEEAPTERLKIVAWNKLAEALYNIPAESQLLLQGRLSMNTLEKSEYKEKVAELILSGYPIVVENSKAAQSTQSVQSAAQAAQSTQSAQVVQAAQVPPVAQAASTPVPEEKLANTGTTRKTRNSKSKAA